MLLEYQNAITFPLSTHLQVSTKKKVKQNLSKKVFEKSDNIKYLQL